MIRSVAIFLPSLDGGGAERVMLSLAERFVARGVRCDLVIAITKGQLLDCVPAGVRLIKLNKHKTITAVFALARYLRRERPNALLATVFTANICACLAAIFALIRVKVVICEANPSGFDMQSSSCWKTAVNMLAAVALYRRANEVIAISHGVRQSLLDKRLAKASCLHVICNPVTRSSSLVISRQGRNTSDLVACGRLEPQKDYPTLLRAFKRVRDAFDARLVVLGEGSLRQALEFQAKDLGVEKNLVFAGFVQDPRQYMLKAAVFVHSARYEGFGIVLLEALTCGCPIVATDCPGGVREVLADGKYGTLVPVGDDEALAAAIVRVLKGEVHFPDASEYLRQFDIERVADAYLSVLFPPVKGPA